MIKLIKHRHICDLYLFTPVFKQASRTNIAKTIVYLSHKLWLDASPGNLILIKYVSRVFRDYDNVKIGLVNLF